MSVADLDAALAFWQRFLGVEARWRQMLERPYLARHLAYPDVRIDAAFLDLPGGIVLELLDYQLEPNVHLCLEVEDAGAAWERAVAAGARPLVPEGPIDVDGGPNQGARAAYLRIHDGISLELFQPPRR
jgi:glyoxylase I family protein